MQRLAIFTHNIQYHRIITIQPCPIQTLKRFVITTGFVQAMSIFKQECAFIPQRRIKLFISPVGSFVSPRMIEYSRIHPVPASVFFLRPFFRIASEPHHQTNTQNKILTNYITHPTGKKQTYTSDNESRKMQRIGRKRKYKQGDKGTTDTIATESHSDPKTTKDYKQRQYTHNNTIRQGKLQILIKCIFRTSCHTSFPSSIVP